MQLSAASTPCGAVRPRPAGRLRANCGPRPSRRRRMTTVLREICTSQNFDTLPVEGQLQSFSNPSQMLENQVRRRWRCGIVVVLSTNFKSAPHKTLRMSPAMAAGARLSRSAARYGLEVADLVDDARPEPQRHGAARRGRSTAPGGSGNLRHPPCVAVAVACGCFSEPYPRPDGVRRSTYVLMTSSSIRSDSWRIQGHSRVSQLVAGRSSSGSS